VTTGGFEPQPVEQQMLVSSSAYIDNLTRQPGDVRIDMDSGCLISDCRPHRYMGDKLIY
jgi:hypothetical protein